MKWQELVIDGYRRVLSALEEALNGLTKPDLNQLPHPDSNSMGWLAWHLSRTQDAEIASLIDEEQLWLKQRWYAQFKRAADPADTGFGHNPAQVAAFRSPTVKTLLGYHRAVLERTEQYLVSLSEVDLERELNEPWFQPLPTVGVRLVSVMSDCLQHVGQVAYMRGLLKGRGWLGY